MRQPRRDDAILVPVSAIRRTLVWVIVLLAIVLAAALLWQNRDRLFVSRDAAYIDVTTYQAVFLTGGQAYFGKLEINGDTYVLRDAYYLNAPTDGAQSLGQLLRRGGELHGPTEPMVIPARSVLFFENMRQDSQVMSAIRQIKSGQTVTPPPATASPARTATPAPSPTR